MNLLNLNIAAIIFNFHKMHALTNGAASAPKFANVNPRG